MSDIKPPPSKHKISPHILPTSSSLSSPYIGRFAPSPSGKLHFGSLISAVASYCDAKANKGKWLLRIEDLDPPREEAGASKHILQSLESHGLAWDGDVLYQSQRLLAYKDTFEAIKDSIYPCDCIRQRILSLNGRYDSHCRHHTPASNTAIAWRLNTGLHPDLLSLSENFDDIFLGPQNLPLDIFGDFIIRRKDTLFSYQFAVVIDDLFQQITHIIRGQDLLDSSFRQRYLLLLLTSKKVMSKTQSRNNNTNNSLPLLSAQAIACLPQYGHTPLALGEDGHKLSKQTKANPINDSHAGKNLLDALIFLGQEPPNELFTKQAQSNIAGENNRQHCTEILNWAISNWSRSKVPTHSSVAPTLADA
jgi:glutamyl-Q tRNA(Asp) synthetase